MNCEWSEKLLRPCPAFDSFSELEVVGKVLLVNFRSCTSCIYKDSHSAVSVSNAYVTTLSHCLIYVIYFATMKNLELG